MADLKSEKTRISKILGIEESKLFPQISKKRNLVGFWTIGQKGKLIEFKLIGLNLSERLSFTLPEIFGKTILESELAFLGTLEDYRDLVSKIQAKKEQIRLARQKKTDEINRDFDARISKLIEAKEIELGFNLSNGQRQQLAQVIELEKERETLLASIQ